MHKTVHGHRRDTQWIVNLQIFKIDNVKQQGIVTSFAVVDPTAAFWIPSADWALYRRAFEYANFTCTDFGYSEACYVDGISCDPYYDTLPTFSYVLNSTAVNLPPKAYTVSYPNLIFPNATNSCSIEMYSSPNIDTMTLGQIFAQQYALKYDYSKGKIGFAINSNAVEGITIATYLSVWTWILIGFGGLIFLIFFCTCVQACRK